MGGERLVNKELGTTEVRFCIFAIVSVCLQAKMEFFSPFGVNFSLETFLHFEAIENCKVILGQKKIFSFPPCNSLFAIFNNI